MLSPTYLNEQDSWINIDKDQLELVPTCLEEFGVDEEFIRYVLDTSEQARMEYDENREVFVMIYHVANRMKHAHHYETVPMIVLVRQHQVITISQTENAYILQYLFHELELESTVSLWQFVFLLCDYASAEYFPLIEEISVTRNMLNRSLRKKTTRKNLVVLSDMSIGMVYFVTASKQNMLVLEQIRLHKVFRTFSEMEKEQFEDALIEAKQLTEVAQLNAAILNRLSHTFNRILENNLNEIMKLMAILLVILDVPTVLIDFFGINLALPTVDTTWISWVFMGLAISSGIVVTNILRYWIGK